MCDKLKTFQNCFLKWGENNRGNEILTLGLTSLSSSENPFKWAEFPRFALLLACGMANLYYYLGSGATNECVKPQTLIS